MPQQSKTQTPWQHLLNEKLEKEMLHRTIPLTSYYLLRQHVLPDVFGRSNHAIMYWSGKSIGNQLQVTDIQSCIDCFGSLQLGTLTVKRESSKELRFTLQNAPLLQFVTLNLNPPFDLSFECGLISGMVENALKTAVSGHYEITDKNTSWPIAEITITIN